MSYDWNVINFCHILKASLSHIYIFFSSKKKSMTLSKKMSKIMIYCNMFLFYFRTINNRNMNIFSIFLERKIIMSWNWNIIIKSWTVTIMSRVLLFPVLLLPSFPFTEFLSEQNIYCSSWKLLSHTQIYHCLNNSLFITSSSSAEHITLT